MLNDLNNLINSINSNTNTETKTFRPREDVVTINRRDLTAHPSYIKGYEMGKNMERGSEPYDIDYNLQEHLIAFSLGYNEGLLEAE